MDRPTEEQKREFWESYGFTRLEYLDGVWHQRLEPSLLLALPIDLNNLFKYAVPKAKERLSRMDCWESLAGWVGDIIFEGKDPALALFWVLWQVKETNEDKT